MASDPHPWAADLETLYAQVWARLVRGAGDRHAPARHPVLATVSPQGTPEARVVVLRAADPVAATLDIHTDLRSAKVAALRVNAQAALLVWDASAHLQTRIEATVAVLTGAAVAEIWARVPDGSRRAYGGHPAPGLQMSGPLAHDPTPDPAAFAVLRCTVQTVDALHLGPRHRRARFGRETGWAGCWLAP